MLQDHTHTEVLFNEINKLIRKVGLTKAIIHIRSLNKTDGESVMDITVYEHIIRTITETFNISETQLFKDQGKYVATDARRSAYVFIHKYLKYSQEAIAKQFEKKRSTVGMEILQFNSFSTMANPTRDIIDYMNNHRKAEEAIIRFIDTINNSPK